MNLQLWYEQASRAGVHTYCGNNCEFLIYKGFKISKFPDKYSIHNVRTNDFYSPPSEKEVCFLVTHGFMKGADIMSYTRNKSRYLKYIRKLEKVYEDQAMFTKNKGSNPKFYDKCLKNCENKILKYVDLLFFYKAFILQYEEKYNINPKFIQNE